MITIWKFPLHIMDDQVVSMPRGSIPLSAAMQNGQLCIWAIVDSEAPKVNKTVFIRGTGHEVFSMTDKKFLGTAVDEEQALVWHVFV